MGATNLPPGFHFFPSDEELVVHFLYRKAARLPGRPDIVPVLDLHQFNPWDLDGKAHQGKNQWYFFTHSSQNRASPNGYWLPIGADEPVTSGGGDREVGMKRTYVFYVGEGSEGIKTNWIMHEYHLSDGGATSDTSTSRRSSKKRGSNQRAGSSRWVICRAYESSSGDYHNDGVELSCLDEVFLSLDDLDEVSLPI